MIILLSFLAPVMSRPPMIGVPAVHAQDDLSANYARALPAMQAAAPARLMAAAGAGERGKEGGGLALVPHNFDG